MLLVFLVFGTIEKCKIIMKKKSYSTSSIEWKIFFIIVGP